MMNIGFPDGSVVKNPPVNAGDTGDMGLIPGLGRSPGVVNDNPLQYPSLEDSMDRGAWKATVHGVTDVTEHTHHQPVGLKLNSVFKTVKDRPSLEISAPF